MTASWYSFRTFLLATMAVNIMYSTVSLNPGLVTPAWKSRSKIARRSQITMANGEAPSEKDAAGGILRQVHAWCGLNGLLYSDGTLNWNAAPVSLVPNAFSKSSFEYANDVQPIINILIDKISRDRDFLLTHLLPVAASDNFVQRQLDIFNRLPAGAVKESVHLGLHRSDYMVNYDESSGTEKPLQVEMNTIASSFGCLSKKVGDLHRFLLLRNENSAFLKELLSQTAPSFSGDLSAAAKQIPENRSVRMLAFALSMAHLLYGDRDAIVVFVVQPGEKNVSLSFINS
jgi:glutathione synthase